MHLRGLRQRDIPAALKLIKENYPHHPHYLRRAKRELKAMFTSDVVIPTYIAAFHKKQLIGFAGLSPSWMDYDVYTLFWVNVKPSFQGQGIGTRMIQLLVTTARRRGSKFLLLTTTKPRFYKRLNFRTVAKLRYRYVLMIRSL